MAEYDLLQVYEMFMRGEIRVEGADLCDMSGCVPFCLSMGHWQVLAILLRIFLVLHADSDICTAIDRPKAFMTPWRDVPRYLQGKRADTR